MNIRNVAIIAHVDHGKTTLVDCLLRQAKTHLGKEFDDTSHLIMDSNELEKERGITIFSKNASVAWKDNAGEEYKINIIDTPGHADFGGEVERVLTMADGCLLLIDAKEGPMPQTRFVLKQALKMKHKIIVVINKIDKPDARINHVINKTFDLFIELGADDATAEFPIVYASAKNGLAGLEPVLSDMKDITPVFDAILKEIPEPKVDPDSHLQMLVTTIGADSHKGRIAIGRILNGKITANQEVMHINREGAQKKVRLTSLMTFEGLGKIDASSAQAGDIVAVTGILDVNIGETIADVDNPIALPVLKIEEPTVRMTFAVNGSPFAGKEGEFKTSRQIEERLYKELETDMALRVEQNPTGGWIVSGRGELHLAIFIERLRREGYEFQVSRPQVINKTIDGKKMTPYEQVFIEVPEETSGSVMQKMGIRHGQMVEMNIDNGIVMYEFIMATKDLFGYRSEFLTDTRGLGIINTIFLDYKEDKGDTIPRERGSLVAFESGPTTHYGLVNAQDRGTLFIAAATPVYKGQVIGQNSRPEDMRINVCKIKQQSNMRSKGEGVSAHADTPKTMSLEDALEYIDDTELVEVTPQNIRIRKKILDENEERRMRAQGKI
ncbi:MAG: translational GTPase TypA [Candidatus Levybacteria bacterium]|nr:translational GTPase TypA [Candidatus Levybacteria bacterium]MBP9814971.1 translational GTPase TypA [Candidatus Levybacteria bacterium]